MVAVRPLKFDDEIAPLIWGQRHPRCALVLISYRLIALPCAPTCHSLIIYEHILDGNNFGRIGSSEFMTWYDGQSHVRVIV